MQTANLGNSHIFMSPHMNSETFCQLPDYKVALPRSRMSCGRVYIVINLTEVLGLILCGGFCIFILTLCGFYSVIMVSSYRNPNSIY